MSPSVRTLANQRPHHFEIGGEGDGKRADKYDGESMQAQPVGVSASLTRLRPAVLAL